jgi:replicative DNA helicase
MDKEWVGVRSVGAPRDTGMILKEVIGDLPEILKKDKKMDASARVPTGLTHLDNVMGGGLGPGEVGVVSAGTGKGKSMALTSFGVGALRWGAEVIHYTLELHADEALLRYAANLTKIPQDHIERGTEGFYNAARYWEQQPNNLLVKYFSPYTVTVDMLWGHLSRVISQTNMHPRLVIVDYADLLLSGTEGGRFSSAEQSAALGRTYHKLRAMGDEFGCAVWTASQIQRSAYERFQADTQHSSWSIEKPQAADIWISLNQDPSEEASNTLRLFLAKFRRGESRQTVWATTMWERAHLKSIDRPPDRPVDTTRKRKRSSEAETPPGGAESNLHAAAARDEEEIKRQGFVTPQPMPPTPSEVK